MGSVIFRLLVAIALRWGLNPNDLKLVTALFVFCALVLPGFVGKEHDVITQRIGRPETIHAVGLQPFVVDRLLQQSSGIGE